MKNFLSSKRRFLVPGFIVLAVFLFLIIFTQKDRFLTEDARFKKFTQQLFTEESKSLIVSVFLPAFFRARKFSPAVPGPVFPAFLLSFSRDPSALPVKNLTAWELLFHLFYSNIFIFKTQQKNG